MAKKRKRNLKWKEARLEDFNRSAVSLGDLFEELASLHPDLTIGRTTSKRDVGSRPDDSFADGKKHGNKLILWHGTTEDRAKAIIEEGFRKAQVWFTSKLPVAQRMAINRARQRSDVPVVISCEIDLEKYPSFGRPDPKTYVFYSPTGKEIIGGVTLGKDVVRDVSVVKAKYSRRSKEKADTHEPIDVIVTRTSGRLGVLWWINRYLELEGEAAVNEDHPAVQAIFKWVEARYAQGIDDPIPDEEMLAQVSKHLKLES